MDDSRLALALTPHGHLVLIEEPEAPGLDAPLAARLGAPPMTGAEYLTAAVLGALWQEMDVALEVELAESKCGVQDFLKRRNPAWNLVGRVHFNLGENRSDPEAPFAFLATYTTRLSAQAKAQHLPLGQALREYAGAAQKERLLSLLLPVQRAAQSCPWLKAMIDRGEIFHPLRWTRPRPSSFYAMFRNWRLRAWWSACLPRGAAIVRRAHGSRAALAASRQPGLARMRCSISAWKSLLTASG